MNISKVLPILLVMVILLSVVIISLNFYYPAGYKEYLSNIKSEVNDFLYEYKDFKDELPVILNDEQGNSVKKTTCIVKSEALDDVEYLFSLLKYGYVGYEFFGGDHAFTTAKENIVWSIIAMNSDTISTREFLDILYKELGFIQDAHFSLGHYILCEYTKYYSSRKYTFYSDDHGFYTFINGEPYYLTEVNGGDP